MTRRLALVAAIVVVVGCWSESTTPDPQPQQTSTPKPIPDALGYVRTVTLSGEPLANMTPIATRKPNAFDQPVAQGEATDAEGRSMILLPQGEQLYVRAWDPAFDYFANNFFTVLPNAGEATDEMVIEMVESASLRAKIYLPNGDPIAHEEVSIMLSHPMQGPWWPSRAQSDDMGVTLFDGLPPGRYIIRFETLAGHSFEMPQLMLEPGGETELAEVRLL